MAPRKGDLTGIGRSRRTSPIHRHVGKGATEQVLPSRGALNTLTQGDPMQRTMNNYAKATPGPLGPPGPPGGDTDTGPMNGS